jgi:hypothetical protein
MPPADYLSLASLLCLAFGVFAFPVAGIDFALSPTQTFGLAVILFVGYILSILSHYNLLFRGETMLPGKFCTVQEFATVVFVLVAAGAYIADVRCQCVLSALGHSSHMVQECPQPELPK